MIRIYVLATAALGAAFLFPGSSRSDPITHQFMGIPCSTVVEIERQLAPFNEKRVAVAKDPGGVLELRVNAETGTYTILLTLKTGSLCVLSAGRLFTMTGEKPGIPI